MPSYYVSQIMQMGEEGIRDAWNKASAGLLPWLLRASHAYGNPHNP